MIRRSVAEALLTATLAWALFEVYLALRPADLTERFYAFLGTTHGRFESYYASRRSDSPPLGE